MPNFSKDKSGFQMTNPMENVTGVKGKTNDLPDMVGSYSNESPEGGDISPLKGWFGNLAKKALDPLGLFKTVVEEQRQQEHHQQRQNQ